MATISFGRQTCGSLSESSSREWLVTDGLGGYAMGTVAGLRTRRYHGVLVVAGEPPIGRRLALASLDPVVVVGDRRIHLATHEWADGTIAPAGHEHLARFDLVDGVPRWRWSVGPVTLEAQLAMVRGRPAVGARWQLLGARTHETVRLEIEALCTWRDVHGERHAEADPAVDKTADGFVFERAYRVRGPGFEPAGDWYRGVHHREEAARGLNPDDDLWFAGRFVADLAPGDACEIEAWAGDLDRRPDPASIIIQDARDRARAVARWAGAVGDADELLAHAADQFVVATPSGPTVVAGYPWFGDWSRDTMTSYEGLFLETKRPDEGRELLRRAASTLSEGMLANTADAGGTEYNTVDASLWFLHAVGRHVERAGDTDLGAELLPALQGIVDHHLAGTRFGIRVDGDGLVTQGADGWALTWMYARVDGSAITERSGKPVEVNALWVDGLRHVGAIARVTGVDASRVDSLANRARASFEARFVRPDGAGLFDVVDGPRGDDASVRPNQLLAASLPYAPIDDAAMVLAAVEPLVTSLGLRSLVPADGRFRGVHRGSPAERDGAYHQGTVWPWLVGPWVDVSVRAGGFHPGMLDGLDAHLGEWGLGSASETADGDAPHQASGCPFQAWSVAELLRARRALASLPALAQSP
jgi:predicted glycogen debranching enzyme